MGALSGGLWGRLSVGALMALGGLAVLQTVPLRRPSASLAPVDYRNLERVVTNGKEVSVLVQKTGAKLPLVFENFHLEWRPSRYHYGGEQFFVGDITNRGAAPCPASFKVLYKDRNQKDAGLCTFGKDELKPGEHFRVRCPMRGGVAAAELLVFDSTPEPLLPKVVPPRGLLFLLLILLGVPLHIGLGAWLRPNGWERRVWNRTLE